MIVSYENLLKYLTAWLRSRVDLLHKKGYILPITGGIDTTVCAAICLAASPALPMTFVFMGFKPENEAVIEKWLSGFSNAKKFIKPEVPVIKMQQPENVNVQQSLVGAYIDIQSKIDDYLTVGAITKSEYSLIKNFTQDLFDCYPLADLYRQEIIELGKSLKIPEVILKDSSLVEHGLGFTYDDLEWLDREDKQTNIINSSSPPNTSRYWVVYNDKQKALINKVYQMNKIKQYQKLLSDKLCLVRQALPGATS